MDMILQAAEKSYHPSCFRCEKCRCSLDGRPFTMDGEEKVYCVDDYHKLFAPRCAKCCKAILPVLGRDETVRVVAMEKDYHVDCYICEFCGLQLTDEPGKRCFPMQGH
uniref:LIM zinc-binding domain-containing protein n=1 Tax=Romanomermis culicivorax TaxID=13658 RepID=A0A915HJR0_ROMCU